MFIFFKRLMFLFMNRIIVSQQTAWYVTPCSGCACMCMYKVDLNQPNTYILANYHPTTCTQFLLMQKPCKYCKLVVRCMLKWSNLQLVHAWMLISAIVQVLLYSRQVSMETRYEGMKACKMTNTYNGTMAEKNGMKTTLHFVVFLFFPCYCG